MNELNVALVHDGIFCRAGGERVLLNMHKAFPSAPIYTAMYDSEATYPEFRKCDIRESLFKFVASNESEYKSRYFPLGLVAMSLVDLTSFDVIIMTTTHCAKYVKFSKKAVVIAYCFTPFRLAWDPVSYSMYSGSTGFKRVVLNSVIALLRRYDYGKASKIGHFIAMTRETRQRIQDSYGYKASIHIVRPTIDTTCFEPERDNDGYYLVVSRLEKYKRVDIVIEAFNKLGYPLVIVGRGVEKHSLKKIANDNVRFLEGVSDRELQRVYQRCKAFIFPQHEDYGLTPLEANACGKPVLAFNKGGVLDTQKPWHEKMENKWTAVFFEDQTAEALSQAIMKFETLTPNCSFIRAHAESFDDKIFIQEIRARVCSILTSVGVIAPRDSVNEDRQVKN